MGTAFQGEEAATRLHPSFDPAASSSACAGARAVRSAERRSPLPETPMRFDLPPPPDADFRAEVQAAIDGKTKPLGALGEMETLALRLALATGSPAPRMETCALLIFCLLYTSDAVDE